MKIEHRAILSALFDAQNGCCPYCLQKLPPMRTVRDQRNPMRPTLDHVMPTGEGGPNRRGNFLAAHARCNTAKGNRFPTPAELETLGRINAILRWPSIDLQPWTIPADDGGGPMLALAGGGV